MFWRCVLVPLFLLTCSPCRVWPASAWLCAPAAAGRSRTVTTFWPWTNSGTCAASSAASVNSTWSLSSPASARTVASSARRTTTGRRARAGSGAPHASKSVGETPRGIFKGLWCEIHRAKYVFQIMVIVISGLMLRHRWPAVAHFMEGCSVILKRVRKNRIFWISNIYFRKKIRLKHHSLFPRAFVLKVWLLNGYYHFCTDDILIFYSFHVKYFIHSHASPSKARKSTKKKERKTERKRGHVGCRLLPVILKQYTQT